MYLLRAVRPLLASRISHAAPLRGTGGKVVYYNKHERELIMLPSTTIACYAFSGCFSFACLYLAYRFIKKAGERDIRRDKFLEKAYNAEYKPRSWPPKSDEINAEEEVAAEEEEAKDEVEEKAKAVSADEAQLQDKARTDSTEMQKEEGSPHEEALSSAQEEEQGAASNMGAEKTQG